MDVSFTKGILFIYLYYQQSRQINWTGFYIVKNAKKITEFTYQVKIYFSYCASTYKILSWSNNYIQDVISQKVQ